MPGHLQLGCTGAQGSPRNACAVPRPVPRPDPRSVRATVPLPLPDAKRSPRTAQRQGRGEVSRGHGSFRQLWRLMAHGGQEGTRAVVSEGAGKRGRLGEAVRVRKDTVRGPPRPHRGPLAGPSQAEGTVTAPPARGTRHSCRRQSHCFLPCPGPLLPRWLLGRHILPKPPTPGSVPVAGGALGPGSSRGNSRWLLAMKYSLAQL